MLLASALAFAGTADGVRAEDETSEASGGEAETEGTAADASEDEGAHAYSASARVARPIASTNAVDPTASATVVDLERRMTAFETFRHVLSEVPGARVIGNGAIGGFQAVAIRGADLSQTTVLFDDLPVGGPEAGAIDLGLFPLPSLRRVEVYRGGAPVWYSSGAIGGVVRLVPREDGGDHAQLSVEGGSFGTYRATGELAASARTFRLHSSFGVFGSEQDFRYLDDNGTRFDPTDDRERRWQNAQFFQGNGVVQATSETRIGRFDLLLLGLGRDGGVPGQGTQRTLQSHQAILQGLGLLAYRKNGTVRGGRAYRLQVRFGTAARRNQFDDPYGETAASPGTFADDRTVSPSGRLAFAIEATRWLEFTTVTNVVHDAFHSHEENPLVPDRDSSRTTLTSALEARLHHHLGPVRFELRPSVTIAHASVDARWDDAGTEMHTKSSQTAPLYRVGAVVAPHEMVAFSASVYSGARFPTVLELFGDRRLVLDNPDLRPENGQGVDGGVTVQAWKGAVCLELEARGFHQAFDDTIVWMQNAQGRIVAQNLPRTTANGFEAGMHLSIGEHVALVGQGTALVTHDDRGYALPLRARGTTYGRFESRSGRLGSFVSDLGGYVDVTFIGLTALKPPLVEWPAHTWVGLGVRMAVLDDALSASFSVRDLFDVGGSDVLGYPLAGRTFTAQLLYRKDL
ncbi:MAG: TonB-dependent receptor plug domain-containing protein [Polyangiales bacterium]